MVPTPKRVDSVEVANTTSKAVSVTVVYDDHKEKKEVTKSHEVAAGSTKHFESVELDMGGFTAVAPVKHVSVSVDGQSPHQLEPNVSGVVNKLEMKVVESGSSVQLQQSH